MKIIIVTNVKCQCLDVMMYIKFAIYTFIYAKNTKIMNINYKHKNISKSCDLWMSSGSTFPSSRPSKPCLIISSTLTSDQRRQARWSCAGMPVCRLEGWDLDGKWRKGEMERCREMILSCRTLRALFWGVSVFAGFGCCRHLLSASNLRNSHS